MSLLNKKINVLHQIYEVYDQFATSLDLACEKYCADCCTCNVTLTTLEAYPIATHLAEKEDKRLLDRLVTDGVLRSFERNPYDAG